MRPIQLEVEHILIRRWASYLSMPLFVVGSAGSLLYYNDAAATILGRPFDAAGDMSVEQLNAVFSTATEDGRPIAAKDLPIHAALRLATPGHKRFRIRALDGVDRLIEVTAFPLVGQGGRNLGALAVFWPVSE